MSIESPTRQRDVPRLDVTSQEFERRLVAHGHAVDEVRLLWEELAAEEPVSPRASGRVLGLGPVIAVYLGLLLVVAASVSLLGLYWDEIGSPGVLGASLALLAAYLAASEVLRRRDLTQPADVLEAVAVGWACLATYAVLDVAGGWPEAGGDLDHVHSGLTAIAAVGLVAALLLLAVRPDPLLLVPIAGATVVLAIDLSELVFATGIDDLGERRIAAFLLPLGLAWIVLGLSLDVARRRRYATWAHWAGLALTGIAVFLIVPKTVPGFAVVGVLGALALFFSAFVRHWSYTVIGAAGVLIATVAAVADLGGVAPLVIALVGIALIVVGVRWSRWRETARDAALAHMPRAARRIVTRLAP